MGYESIITDDHEKILSAEKVILPGVGEAGTAMKYLKANGLDNVILSVSQPFLGICLGLQLMCRHTEEGDTNCLGIFNTEVRHFPKVDIVPHTGWNNFFSVKSDLFSGISENDDFYYVHSYYAEISQHTTAVCDYILPFSAAMQKGNFYATQFHPEKSAEKGEIILKNFLEL
jgi:glutamine amidotransferase